MPVQQAGSVLGLRLAMAPEEEGPALRGRQLLRTQNGPLALPPFILIFLLILILLFLHLIIMRGRQLLRTQNGPLALPPFILIFLLILILLFLHLIISSPSLLGDGRPGWFGVLV